VVIGISALLCHRGIQDKFEYNFEKLGFPNQNAMADSIVQEAGEAIASPTVVISPSQDEALRVAEFIRKYKAQDTLTPTIHSVMSLTNTLPSHQDEKLDIIAKLKNMITPKITANLEEPLRKNLEKLKDAWNVRKLTTEDLPESIRKKFLGRDRKPGNFTFIFPSVDLKNGLNCMAFAEDTRKIQIDSNTTYHTSGIAVIYADLLNLMIPDTLKAISLALLTVIVLVRLHTRSWRGTLVILIPIVLGILWTAGAMKIFGIKISYFNLVVLPAMIGIGIDNSVHLYHRYQEEGLGSLHFVMKRTGCLISVASLTSIAGFFGLTFSSHTGLLSMGLAAVMGIGLTLLATFTFVPIVLGYFDATKSKVS
jgi:predicted RND superfamily exporter protein